MQELCFGHVTLEIPVKHSSGDAEQMVGSLSLELMGEVEAGDGTPVSLCR